MVIARKKTQLAAEAMFSLINCDQANGSNPSPIQPFIAVASLLRTLVLKGVWGRSQLTMAIFFGSFEQVMIF
jgi:hypothetical protein